MAKGTLVYCTDNREPFVVTETPERVRHLMHMIRESIEGRWDRMIVLTLEEEDDGTPSLDFSVAVDHIVALQEYR